MKEMMGVTYGLGINYSAGHVVPTLVTSQDSGETVLDRVNFV